MKKLLCVITGERGVREIVEPLDFAEISYGLINWEKLKKNKFFPHLIFIREFFAEVKNTKPEVVFTDLGTFFLIVMGIISWLYNYKIIFRLRGNPFFESKNQIRFSFKKLKFMKLIYFLITYILMKIAFLFVNKFVPVSKWLEETVKLKDSEVINTFCNLKDILPKENYGLSNNVQLLVATNFDYEDKIKPIFDFIDCNYKFMKENNIHITIFGQGLCLNHYLKIYNKRKNVSIKGFTPNLKKKYKDYDIFMHLSNLDAYPYTVLEAQAAGLPVIVSKFGGMKEQIKDSYNGFFVNKENIIFIIEKLLKNKKLRESIGNKGRETVRENNSKEVIALKIRDIIMRFK